MVFMFCEKKQKKRNHRSLFPIKIYIRSTSGVFNDISKKVLLTCMNDVFLFSFIGFFVDFIKICYFDY